MISFTLEESGSNGVGLGTVVTDSWTPPANKPIYAAFSYSVFAGPISATETCSGNGLTWVKVTEVLLTDDTDKIVVFRALGSSPSAGATTMTITGATNLNGAWAMVSTTDADTSGTNGSGSVVQFDENADRGSGGPGSPLTVTLSALGDAANNAVLAFFTNASNQPFTANGGYTELSEDTTNSSMFVQYKVPGTTTPSMTADGDFTFVGGIAIEVKSATTEILRVLSSLGCGK